MYTYHLEVTIPADAVEGPKVILHEDIQLFIKDKLIEYNQTTNGKVYIKQGMYYVFVYVPTFYLGVEVSVNRVDISR